MSLKGVASIFPVPDHETARAGDILLLSIGSEELIELVSKQSLGLRVGSLPALELTGSKSQFVEIVLAPQSPSVGRLVSTGPQVFENLYRVRLVAVRSRGDPGGSFVEKQTNGAASPKAKGAQSPGNPKARELPKTLRAGHRGRFSAGDTVLVLATTDTQFPKRDFYSVTKIADLQHPPQLLDYLPLPLFAVGLALTACGLVPMVQVALTLSVIFTLGGWVDAREIPSVIDWHLLILIGSALGLSQAVRSSGLSALIALGVKALGLPPRGSAMLLYLATMITTELITNNAAAALGIPLAVDIAAESGLASPRPLAMVVMLAASTSFACPIGYATNLMVMGPGGYTFNDFFRVGFPLDVIFWIGCSLIVPLS
eukprot:gnl/TRDRNA2_/TRDRNA2_168277_c0_seq1.p1 gnl/TRDRNA2_/TRDRNA2_168277_c0~~gnl/TRDRNA2_/TRDRNA2_168277_c0_seq1.p1  ORF type:complete len:381 (+),score=42.57 gnl/TRDRNA2_/TRDRNA2_168277_c0_seq1:32-1144(+)